MEPISGFHPVKFIINAWTASLYTTLMDSCATTCPFPGIRCRLYLVIPLTPWTGYTVELTATITSGSPVIKFYWDFNDGSTGIGTNPSIIFLMHL